MPQHSQSILGFSQHASVKEVSIGFVIIVIFLVVAEHGLSMLDSAVRSTAYAAAVQSLYKELVIMVSNISISYMSNECIA
jgi:hypothetical protein